MKKLTTITLLYSAIPTCIFIFFWVKLAYAIVALLAITTSFYLIVSGFKDTPGVVNDKFNMHKAILSSSVIAFVVCYFSEFGGYSYQSFDYQAHNYKFNMLATQRLPLYDPDMGIYMCYYLGYYLVPSLLGKVTSISLVKVFAFIWTWIGVSLSFSWIQIRLSHLAHKQRIMICLLLVLGSYVSVILPVISKALFFIEGLSSNSININGNFRLIQIPILSRGLSEAPQHILPAVLGISFFLVVANNIRYVYAFSFFIFSTLFWTPFTSIGLGLFYFYLILKGTKQYKLNFLFRFVNFNLLLVAGFFPVILFLISSSATNMNSNMLIWQSRSDYWMVYYILYLFSFFGVWFLFFKNTLFKLDRKIMLISFTSFACIGLMQIGYYNDMVIKASVPSQVFLGLSISYLIVVYHRILLNKLWFKLGVLFLVLNASSFVKFHYERIFVFGDRGFNTIERTKIRGYEDNYYAFLKKGYENGEEAVRHYTLKRGSLFEEYFLDEN